MLALWYSRSSGARRGSVWSGLGLATAKWLQASSGAPGSGTDVFPLPPVPPGYAGSREGRREASKPGVVHEVVAPPIGVHCPGRYYCFSPTLPPTRRELKLNCSRSIPFAKP